VIAALLQPLRDLLSTLPADVRAALAVEVGDADAWLDRAGASLQRLVTALEPVMVSDPQARTAALAGLHRTWKSDPAASDLRRLRELTPPSTMADLLSAVLGALDAPTAPDEAAFGAALQPSLDALRDEERAIADEAGRKQVQKSVDDLFADFVLPPLSGS
jgi:hypothetical protein